MSGQLKVKRLLFEMNVTIGLIDIDELLHYIVMTLINVITIKSRSDNKDKDIWYQLLWSFACRIHWLQENGT